MKKYVHTKQDKKDDILFIKKFTKSFELKFKEKMSLLVLNMGEKGGKDNYVYCVPGISYGAETVFFTNNTVGSREMIWLQTGINPNDIKQNLIARTFEITYNKYVKDKKVRQFREYSVHHYDEVINKFEDFLYPKEVVKEEEVIPPEVDMSFFKEVNKCETYPDKIKKLTELPLKTLKMMADRLEWEFLTIQKYHHFESFPIKNRWEMCMAAYHKKSNQKPKSKENKKEIIRLEKKVEKRKYKNIRKMRKGKEQIIKKGENQLSLF